MFDRQPLPEHGSSIALLHRPFSHMYFTKRLDHWARACNILSFFCTVIPGGNLLAGITSDSSPSRRCISRVSTSRLVIGGENWTGFVYFCVPTLLPFAYYYGYVLKHHLRQDVSWRIATSEFMVCEFISFLGLTFAGTSSSVCGDSRILNFNKVKLVSLSCCLHGHAGQYNVFEVLRDSSYDMNLGFSLKAVLRMLIGASVSRFGSLMNLMQG